MSRRNIKRAQSRAAAVSGSSRQVDFEVNPFYEKLLQMRDQNPATFKLLSGVTRLAVEAYVKARQAATGPCEAAA